MSESSRLTLHYLDHIRWNAHLSSYFIEGMTYDEYVTDYKTQFACERAILNLSEATRRLEEGMQAIDGDFHLSSISNEIDWSKAKGIGNVLRHDYDDLRHEILWQTIREELPQLQAVAEEHLSQHSAFHSHDLQPSPDVLSEEAPIHKP